MGRWTASYRGHLVAYHGGDINGFHSQISYMPSDSVGVIVLVIGDHAAPLYNVVSYNVYERLLGLDQTPWSQRLNDARKKAKQAGMAARAQAGGGQVKGTRPAHPRGLRRRVRESGVRRRRDLEARHRAAFWLSSDRPAVDPLSL